MPLQACRLTLNQQQREIELRGTPLFPCGVYATQLDDTGLQQIPWHWHPKIELLWVKRGQITLAWGEQNTVLLKAGDGAFINANVMHHIERCESPCAELQSFVFHTDLIGGADDNILEQRYLKPLRQCHLLAVVPLCSETEWQRSILNHIQIALDAFAHETFAYEWSVRNHLSSACQKIAIQFQNLLLQDQHPESSAHRRTRTMLEYIHQHFADPLKLNDIARAAHISSREALRCFQSILGTTPIQYLMQYRLTRAAQQLHNSTQSITQIATENGFGNASYFTQQFQRRIGCTPKAYRKQKKQ